MRPVAQSRISKGTDRSVLICDRRDEVIVFGILLTGRRDGASMNTDWFAAGQKIEHVVNVTSLPKISPAAFRRVNPMVKGYVPGIHAVIDDQRCGSLPQHLASS